MEDKLRTAIQDALNEIATTMLFVDVQPVDENEQKADASVEVKLSGGINGGLHLNLPLGGARALAAALMGETPEGLDDETKDAIGELANMIAGGLQTRMSGELGEINLTPPEITIGPKQLSSDGEKRLHLPFQIESENFSVELRLQS